MTKTKEVEFKLNPDWMFRDPIDFEYNKFILLDYLQKCSERFYDLKLYPDFIELSLHLTNIHSLYKEKKLLYTDKKFRSCDDEILLKELTPKKTKKLTDEETDELTKTIQYSGDKLFGAFNLGKSIWTIAYDNIHIDWRNVDSDLSSDYGFFYKLDEYDNRIIVWQYIKESNLKSSNKFSVLEIYSGPLFDDSLLDVILTKNTLNLINLDNIPMFEVTCQQSFPIDETLVPMVKRKINTLINQSVVTKKVDTDDSELN